MLKIDIDGDDYPCFRSFAEQAECRNLQAVDIESQFHGDDGPDGNTFVNISILARNLGLDLYSLDAYRYSRATLPGRFVYHFPAQTETGQVLWGDAVFMRDPMDAVLRVDELLRQVALFHIYDLDDCAHEILVMHGDRLRSIMPVDETLARISSQNQPKANGKGTSKVAGLLGALRRRTRSLMRNIKP